MNNLHFIPNNIHTNFFKQLTKYINNYQQYLNYIYMDYIMHLIIYIKCIHAYAQDYKLVIIIKQRIDFSFLKSGSFFNSFYF